jgi:hypothetical protein
MRRKQTKNWGMPTGVGVMVLFMVFGLEVRAAEAGSDWNSARAKAVNRQRRIIFNNDGNEPVYFCKESTEAELLASRTRALAESQVDSIFYCTWSSGFGLFTHHTSAGQVFNTREAMFKGNRTQDFLDRGIDPLSVMVKFAHQHGKELFWSMRMNDTHDAERNTYGPVMFRTNTLKRAHPEWLLGSREHPPKHGAWSGVDYGVKEIRELALSFCEEVCTNYDVDGLELDFFRHAIFFKTSAKGEPCSEADLNAMTELIERIRKLTEERGKIRSRPILVAVRVPDSVEYCKLIGLDLEKWLSKGLVDLLVVGGYTQLNPWEYSVQLAHKYGVKVYPSLDESRVRAETARALRSRLESYRGRALNVWGAGADGVYVFNFFDPQSELWRQLGNEDGLRKLDRDYFASVRGVGSMPVPHQKFLHVATLNPGAPVRLTRGREVGIRFVTNETEASERGCENIVLALQFKGQASGDEVRVRLNGVELKEGKMTSGWLQFPLKQGVLRKGENEVLATGSSKSEEASLLQDLRVMVRCK